MKTIKGKKQAELLVKKSKFIALVLKIDNKTEADEAIKAVRENFADAKHIVWAYRFENQEKYTDAQEPKGTAGSVLFNLIKKQDINNCLLIVVRYFGGIKLGRGGLIKAYTEAGQLALENNLEDWKVKIQKKEVVPLAQVDRFKKQLRQQQVKIISLNFSDQAEITYEVEK